MKATPLKELKRVSYPSRHGMATWQLCETPEGTKMIVGCHFWKDGEGEFHPPSSKVQRLVIKPEHAKTLMSLLTELQSSNE